MRQLAVLAIAFILAGALAVAGATFESADQNGDGRVTMDEFYGPAAAAKTFADRDRDANGFIDRHEYDAFGASDDFGLWDADGDARITDAEYYEGSFSTFDADGSGYLDPDEWEAAVEAGWLGR